jgi:hypothetical protein
MVRFLVGTCLEIGRGNRNVEEIDELLATGDRKRTPAPAPARALYLLRVGYGSQWRRDEHPQVPGPLPVDFVFTGDRSEPPGPQGVGSGAARRPSPTIRGSA